MFNVHVNVFYLVAFCLVVFIFGWWKGQRDAISDLKAVREKFYDMDEKRRARFDELRTELLAFGADVSKFASTTTDLYDAYSQDLARALRMLSEDEGKRAEKFRWHSCAWCGAFTSAMPHALNETEWMPATCLTCLAVQRKFSLAYPPPRAGLRPVGLVFPGWSCAHCRVFNGESKAPREDCRCCGAVRERLAPVAPGSRDEMLVCLHDATS